MSFQRTRIETDIIPSDLLQWPFRNETKVVFHIAVRVCSVLVAVMAVRMDVRDSRNDRMRSLCAVY